MLSRSAWSRRGGRRRRPGPDRRTPGPTPRGGPRRQRGMAPDLMTTLTTAPRLHRDGWTERLLLGRDDPEEGLDHRRIQVRPGQRADMRPDFLLRPAFPVGSIG